ncbi:MAG: amidohydrolase family protein, partial [Leadbetterella sp.]
RLGTIEKGKDADLVVWNANPLSIYATPEKTIIDGALYFDKDKEESNRKAFSLEKNALVQKLIQEKSSGAPVSKPNTKSKPSHVHCDSVLEFDGKSVEEFENFINNSK